MADTVTPEIRTELASLGQEKQQAQTQLAGLGQADEARAAAHEAALRPQEDALTAETARPMAPRQHAQMPAQPGKPPVDPKEYEGLSYALIGMALVGGAVSHGNWMGASASLNGALKGMLEGNQQQAKAEYDKYDRAFKSAVEMEKQFDSEYQDALANRKISINEMLQRINITARRQGAEDIAAATKTKNLQTVISQIEARRTQLMGTEQRAQAVQVRVDASLQRGAGGGRGGKNAPQTDAGSDLASLILERGGQVSFFGGKGPMYDKIAQRAQAEGKSLSQAAEDVLSGKITLGADTTVARTTAVRQAAVKRLTSTVMDLEGRVLELAKANGNARNPDYNLTMNAITKRFGGAKGQHDLAELQTLMGSVGRLYQEAVTMPGSNAQMHATAQQWADGHFNENQSLAQIKGAIDGMNREIKSTEKSLGESKAEAERRPAPGAAAAADHPPDIAALLGKYSGSDSKAAKRQKLEAERGAPP